MSEKWVHWEPIPNLSGKYQIESIFDGMEGFKMIFFDVHNTSHKVSIFFPDALDNFRSLNIKFAALTFDYLDQNYGSSFYQEWSFFKIDNSNYMKWISEQSYGIFDPAYSTHFCILTTNSIIDFINTEEPEVCMITEDKL